MPFDETIAARVRPVFARRAGFAEKKMFGGVGFLLDGNMCVGVWKHWLIARIGPDAYAAALQKPGVKEFDITGRPMTGWVMIDPSGARDELELNAWIDQAVEFVRTLPAK
jgi:TfoX/Sxy family transcriptional regulator of competence genes